MDLYEELKEKSHLFTAKDSLIFDKIKEKKTDELYVDDVISFGLKSVEVCFFVQNNFTGIVDLRKHKVEDVEELIDIARLFRNANGLLVSDFTLQNIAHITEEQLKTIAEAFADLRILSLRNFGHKIADKEVAFFIQKLPKLETLDLTDDYPIKTATIKAVGENCPELNTLILSGCIWVEDAGLEAVGKGCPNVETLDLRGCTYVTDKGLQAVAHGCKHLRNINLFWCHFITDTGLRAIARNCKELESLDLSYCKHVTDACVADMIRSCKELKSLNLQGCEGVKEEYRKLLTEEDLKKLREEILSRPLPEQIQQGQNPLPLQVSTRDMDI